MGEAWSLDSQTQMGVLAVPSGAGPCFKVIFPWKVSFFSCFPPLNKQNRNVGIKTTELLYEDVAGMTGFLPGRVGPRALQLRGRVLPCAPP